jgi:hypothetical protein
METTSGVTYRRPSLNGPVEPIDRQFYKTQRWNVIQATDLGNSKKFIINSNLNLNFRIYRKKLQT